MFQVKNMRQALDALAYYCCKEAVQSLVKERGDTSLPSYDSALDKAYAIAYGKLASNNSSDDFSTSVQRHLPKFLK